MPSGNNSRNLGELVARARSSVFAKSLITSLFGVLPLRELATGNLLVPLNVEVRLSTGD